MKIKYLLAASMISLSAATMIAAPAAAQQITSGIEGRVVSDTGESIGGASVAIIDTRTGQTRTITTGSDGFFRAETLTTGGPYTITATADGFEGQSVENQFINLQGNSRFTFTLLSGEDANTIVVTGAKVAASQLAVGPGEAFDQRVLESFPSVTRDIRDIIRFNPLVAIDRANEVDRVSCLGGNDRSNSFTVDGINQSDTFGLNGTPFASRNSLPIPFDAIRETSVEFAPFDVEYSQFSGCAINTVTKSGTNEFSGTAFFTYTGDSLNGDRVDDLTIDQAPFDRFRWGATLGGPIIKDRLFFFVGYEETDLGDSFDNGPSGAGFANGAAGVSLDQFNEISTVLSDVFGIDTGPVARNVAQSDRRFFGRVDWLIDDNHRLELTYQRLDEANIESDDFNINDSEITGLNSFEIEGTASDYYSARLFSQWTDNLSTEIRVSRSEVQDIQGPVGGGEAQSANPIPRFIVGVDNATGSDGAVIAGPGIFRSANELNQQVDLLKFQVNLSAGAHDLKFGTEINELEVFNLFAVNATGSLFFANVDDLREGLLTGGLTGGGNPFADVPNVVNGTTGGAVINATPSGDINEAAATFTRTIFSVYAQDDWRATDQLAITAGVRIDFFDGDAPTANPTFLDRFGFSNAVPFSNLGPVVQPRVAFTYDLDDSGFLNRSKLTGGVGIYSGGDPTVFFSNAFSNNGFSSAQGDLTGINCAGLPLVNGQVDVTPGGTFAGFPQCVVANASAIAAAGLADTQSTDPSFKVPTVLRANLGFDTTLDFSGNGGFFDNWGLNVQYIFSRFRNPLNFVDLSQTINPALGNNGFAADGRGIFRAINPSNAGCNADLQGTGGTPPTFTNVTAACFATGRDDEIQLTNTRGVSSHALAFGLDKFFNSGIFTDNGSARLSLGYAFVDSNNSRDNGSSTATSSFDVTAAFNRQDPDNSTSNFETQNRFTARLDLSEEFIKDYDTRFGISFIAQSGRPYSLTFDGQGVFNDSASGSDNALLYIPTGINDPNISPLSNPTAVTNLIDFVTNETNCEFTLGQPVARNSCRNDWQFDLDFRFSQEIPGPGSLFGGEDKIQLFADFDNALNLISSRANTVRARGGLVDVVDGAIDAQGRFIIDGFNPDANEFIVTSASLWRIVVGVRYEF